MRYRRRFEEQEAWPRDGGGNTVVWLHFGELVRPFRILKMPFLESREINLSHNLNDLPRDPTMIVPKDDFTCDMTHLRGAIWQDRPILRFNSRS